jgi:ABC-type multidrug transport system fused ATPase/permease subunit
MGDEISDNKVSRNVWLGDMKMKKTLLLFSVDRRHRLTRAGLFCSLCSNPQGLNQAVDADDNDGGVTEEDIIKVSETFQPHKNDGYALIQSVTTSNGKKLLHEMKVLMPEGSVTAILGPSGAGKSTLLNTLTNSLSINSTAVADST